MGNRPSSNKSRVTSEDEKVLRTIEDLRSEVRELRNMVNMLMEIIVSLETHDDLDLDIEPNMMGYDDLLKSGHYCM
ncbi:MAG: hypothetical protein JXA22_10170 [Candidatus Thermoplasmatota archaeon]|nr:hypothetical protein [Candidatus Thermoplasmatota archaeon]